VWVNLHRQTFAKAPLDEDRRRIAHSVVNTVAGSVPRGRFLSLNIHTGIWYDVGYEKAVNVTMEILADKTKDLSPAASPVAPPRRSAVQKTLASKAA
jgi:hypothetical protein